MTVEDIPAAVREWWRTLNDAPPSRAWGEAATVRKALSQHDLGRAPDGAVVAFGLRFAPSRALWVKRDGRWVFVTGAGGEGGYPWAGCKMSLRATRSVREYSDVRDLTDPAEVA